MAKTTSTSPNLEQLLTRVTITVPEAAELLGLSPNSARKAVERGEIPVQRYGRRVVVPVPALLLQLLGVADVPDLARQFGDLGALVRFLGGDAGGGA